MNNSKNQFFMILLMDLVNENLLTTEEAEIARQYYLKDAKMESASNRMERGKVA